MFDLEKDNPFDLTKAEPELQYIRVGLSWDSNEINGNSPDCDVSAFLIGANGKLPAPQYLVFYNNLCGRGCSQKKTGGCQHESGASGVKHWGDNRTGEGEGDDELLDVNLSIVENQIEQIVFVVTINNANEGFHFGNVTNPSVRVYNAHTNEILCQYEMNQTANGNDALLIARLYRNGNSWIVDALGNPFTGGLSAAIEMYKP
jgi:tellurium resistance protein TerD